MDFNKITTEFSVTIYGDLIPYNSVLSKARVRIFYKYGNRNGSYITDEFAEKLLSSLAYVPIKGIYDEDSEDYTDHGNSGQEGRIYGIVPKEYNLGWEDFEDVDGVTRTYACADVLLFTGLYEEAKDIVGKSQSMEIYKPSIRGNWQIIDGNQYFVFTDGCFVGLQVLGDDVEPCFEGAAFFNLYSSLKQMVEQIENYELNHENNGGKSMVVNFKLSDDQKASLIFQALNPEFTEEGNWTIRYSLGEVYDEYVLAYDYEEAKYVRVYYTKSDDSDSIELGDMVEVFIVDVTEDEKKTLAAVQAINGGTYKKLDEVVQNVQELEQKVTEYTETISTLETEKAEKEILISNYESEIESLKTYKLEKETQDKLDLIKKYSIKLDEEIISKYTEEVEKYSIDDLEKNLAFEIVQKDPSIFSVQEPLIPTTPEEPTGITGLLEQAKNKKNGGK